MTFEYFYTLVDKLSVIANSKVYITRGNDAGLYRRGAEGVEDVGWGTEISTESPSITRSGDLYKARRGMQ